MAKCSACRGSGNCPVCKGSGSVKDMDTHPSPYLIDEDGEVTCFACGGGGNCETCAGSGEVDDDEDDE